MSKWFEVHTPHLGGWSMSWEIDLHEVIAVINVTPKEDISGQLSQVHLRGGAIIELSDNESKAFIERWSAFRNAAR